MIHTHTQITNYEKELSTQLQVSSAIQKEHDSIYCNRPTSNSQ